MRFIHRLVRSKIFLFTAKIQARRGLRVRGNMTHFPGFRRGNLRPALRIFFVLSRLENVAGNVKWKLKNWKKGEQRVGARLVMLYRLTVITFAALLTISLYASYYLKLPTLSRDFLREIPSFFMVKF